MYWLTARKPGSSINPYLLNRCIYFRETEFGQDFCTLTTLDHNTSLVLGSLLIGRRTSNPTTICLHGNHLIDRLNQKYVPKKSKYKHLYKECYKLKHLSWIELNLSRIDDFQRLSFFRGVDNAANHLLVHNRNDRLRKLGFSSYQDYLQSEHWNAVKKSYRSRHPKICFLCNSVCKIALHHTTYANLGDELDIDLIWVCKNCHFNLHEDTKWEMGESLFTAHMRTTDDLPDHLQKMYSAFWHHPSIVSGIHQSDLQEIKDKCLQAKIVHKQASKIKSVEFETVNYCIRYRWDDKERDYRKRNNTINALYEEVYRISQQDCFKLTHEECLVFNSSVQNMKIYKK